MTAKEFGRPKYYTTTIRGTADEVTGSQVGLQDGYGFIGNHGLSTEMTGVLKRAAKCMQLGSVYRVTLSVEVEYIGSSYEQDDFTEDDFPIGNNVTAGKIYDPAPEVF